MGDNMKHRRLQELGESDFEIVEGQPDIRGWDVKNEQGQKIGEVEELILDAQLRKVRYMVVDLDDNDLDLDDLDDKEVLIPIGLAQLDKEDDDVIVPSLSTDQLLSLPDYDDDNLTPDVERTISSVLGRAGISGTANVSSPGDYDENFYNHEHFNDENLYRLRQPAATTASASTGTRGMQFRDRMGQSGSEVEGYTGTEGLGNERSGYRNRTGSFREENIEDNASVPVNRGSLDDAEELRTDRDISSTDRNTGGSSDSESNREDSL